MFGKKTNVQQELQSQLSQLYDQYVDKVFRFIFFKTSDKHIAEDLTSDVFLKVWETLCKEQKLKNINAFIYTVARNIVIDYYRRKKVNYDLGTMNEAVYSISHEECVKEIHISIEMRPIYKALRNVKNEYREVIILKYVDQLSIAEISQILDKKRGNVRVLLHRALQNLRDVITAEEERSNQQL